MYQVRYDLDVGGNIGKLQKKNMQLGFRLDYFVFSLVLHTAFPEIPDSY